MDFARVLSNAASGIRAQDREATRSGEANSLEKKLLAIALDRSERPEPYREIEERYVRYRASDRPVDVSPLVLGIHRTSAYRLPWEYYLLTPMPVGAFPSYQARAASALGRIGDPRSCLTLGHFLRVGLRNSDVSLGLEGCRACEAAVLALMEIAAPEAANAIASAFPTDSAAGSVGRARSETLELMSESMRRLGDAKRERWVAILEHAAASSDPALKALAEELRQRL